MKGVEFTEAHRKVLADVAKTERVPDTRLPKIRDAFYDLIDMEFVVIEGLGIATVTKPGKAKLRAKP